MSSYPGLQPPLFLHIWQWLPTGDVLVDECLSQRLGYRFWYRQSLGSLLDHLLDNPFLLDLFCEFARVHELVHQRLAKLTPIPIYSTRLVHGGVAEIVSFSYIVYRRVGWHVDGLGYRSRDERLSRSHHLHMSGPVNRSLAVLATGCSTVEDCQMLVFQLRRALYHVVAEDEVVG